VKILYFYRGRVAFSFAGVTLGILSICIIITTIDGANQKAYQLSEALGPDSIMVFSGGERQRAARERFNTITEDDAQSLARVAGIYDMVRVLGARNITIRYKDRNWSSFVVGTTANYFSNMSWKVDRGSVFDVREADRGQAVCVLGSKVYDELFKNESGVGKGILVGKLPVTVLGVLEERGGSFGGPHVDDRVIMPLQAVMGRIVKERKYLSFIRLKTSRDVDQTIEDVRAILRTNHRITTGEDDFTIRSSKDVIAFRTVITGQLFIFLGTASIIALFVSGFVLANLFYLAIQERKKDIGIRRAYGASRKGILTSFLIESVIITLAGGVAGIILSLVLGSSFEAIFSIPMVFSFRVVVFAIFFSLVTGVLAGLKPALKASRIEPIEAIRG